MSVAICPDGTRLTHRNSALSLPEGRLLRANLLGWMGVGTLASTMHLAYSWLCGAERLVEVNEYMIDVRWDAAACVWVATSQSVPGVAVEAATCEEILGIFEDVLPDLFRSNGLERGEGKVSVVFDTRVETIHMAAA